MRVSAEDPIPIAPTRRKAGRGAVLLLNASYEPLAVLPMKRAILLVLSEKAEVMEEADGEVRSAHMSMPMPSVIRLTYFVKVPYRARIPLNRRAVLTRDKGECAYCERRVASTIDHIQPRSRGGQHRWENVVAACGPCNSKKDDKTLAELGWTLRFKPYAPTGTFWLIIGLSKISEDWLPYLNLNVPVRAALV